MRVVLYGTDVFTRHGIYMDIAWLIDGIYFPVSGLFIYAFWVLFL